MSVKYMKVQNRITGNKCYGMWYGKAVVSDVIDTKALAEAIEEKCTVTHPDVVAVLAALADELKRNLQLGNKVTLDGVGSFKVGMSSTAAENPEDFTATNVKKLRIIFQPEITVTMSGTSRVHTINALQGCKVEELQSYTSPTVTVDSGSNSGSSNQGTGGTSGSQSGTGGTSGSQSGTGGTSGSQSGSGTEQSGGTDTGSGDAAGDE